MTTTKKKRTGATLAVVIVVLMMGAVVAAASAPVKATNENETAAVVNATTDEPNIPIEPPAEDEKEPDEPILPDNENETDNLPPPANNTGDDDGDGVYPDCDDIGIPGNGDPILDYCIDDDGERIPVNWDLEGTWITVLLPDGTPISDAGPDGTDAGSITSTTVVVEFGGMVEGPGVHIELRIDNGPYTRATSPHTIKGLSDGFHTIYARMVAEDGYSRMLLHL